MSLTLVGLVVAVLATVLKAAGVEVPNEALTTWVLTAGQIIGALAVYLGRVRQGDITWYGRKV